MINKERKIKVLLCQVYLSDLTMELDFMWKWMAVSRIEFADDKLIIAFSKIFLVQRRNKNLKIW
jgi:hypothetical protein